MKRILAYTDFHKSNRTFEKISTANAPSKREKYPSVIASALVCSFLIVLLSGCSNLRSLMRYSNEQDALQRYVSTQKKQVERLFADIEEGKLVIGTTAKRTIIRHYGEPVLVKKIENKERLLYRDPMEYFSSPRAYLLFDEDGILENIEIVPKNP